MQKVYSRINWENYPSENTPLNESNLNRTDYALDEIDDRVIALDTDKASVTDISNLVQSIAVDDTTGVITLTKYNGSTTTIQTTLNKIAVNFTYDYSTQALILTLNDGTTATISLSALIQNNEFDDTATIDFTVSSLGRVSAKVVEHSIGDEHLRTNYLADIRVAEANAAQSESDAEAHMFNSEAWAVGERDGSPVVIGDDTYQNNSKYYRQRSEAWAIGKVDGSAVQNTDVTYQNNSLYYADVARGYRDATQTIRNDAADLLQAVTDRLTGLNILVNYADGCLYYDINSGIILSIDYTTGNLMYDITT
ncbi:MAG: hypothetical protein IKT30_06890 [Bacteroidaceae bacterium]|nr:hypothetical protein [Bacteroidaceae bacterium]